MRDCHNLTEDAKMSGAVEAEGVILAWAHLFLCTGTLAVSLLNLAVLTRPRMLGTSSVNYLLAALEVGNLVFALLHLPIYLTRFAWPQFLVSESYQILYVTIIHIIWADILFITWMTVLVGTWRYILIARPLQARYCLTKSLALAWTSVVVVICALMSVLQFMGFQFQFPLPEQDCSIRTWPAFYDAVWNSLSFDVRCALGHFYLILGLVIYLAPVVCLLFINALIIRKLRQVRKRRQVLRGDSFTPGFETRTTVAIILLMWLFLVGYAPACLSVAVQLFWTQAWSVPLPWEEQLWEFIPSLVVGILSVFGYYFMNHMYQEAFCDVLRCRPKTNFRSTSSIM